MKFEPGQRVRCIDDKHVQDVLRNGREYTIAIHSSWDLVTLRDVVLPAPYAAGLRRYRFKPIVRVKMGRAVA